MHAYMGKLSMRDMLVSKAFTDAQAIAMPELQMHTSHTSPIGSGDWHMRTACEQSFTNYQLTSSLIWEVFRLVKYSAKAIDNSASEAATCRLWQ